MPLHSEWRLMESGDQQRAPPLRTHPPCHARPSASLLNMLLHLRLLHPPPNA